MSDRIFDVVEQIIREGQERGEFDDLPGSGKPLPKHGDEHDPNWWVKGLIERVGLDKSALLPEAFQLRRAADAFPESLTALETEDEVRAVLADFNRRVRRQRLNAVTEIEHRLLAPLIDTDEMVTAWRQEKTIPRRKS